ncbi:MAG: hypothetical protein F4186_08375 [Boseongicola sp. SB0676_bin_33]|nr:hypothetical protein [Boseongicola sp. SB0676_bin_33]
MPDMENDVARRALKIAQELVRTDSGERAAARRMATEGAPVFWRMVARLEIDRNEEERWRRITKALALLTPASATESIHEAGRNFGTVLADGGDARSRLNKPFCSELRLARLRAARGAARLDAIERAVRMMARGRPRVDVPSLAWAYLKEDGRMIARAYYRRLDRHQESSQEEQSDV